MLICTVVSRDCSIQRVKGEAYQVLQNNLSASLNTAGSKVVAGSRARGTPEQLAEGAKYQELLTVSNFSIRAEIKRSKFYGHNVLQV